MKRKQKIDGQFAPRTIAMLRSPAMRVLSLSGRRILDRIEIELASHGGRDNGKLPVTFCNFEEFGIGNRSAIARGIREVCALGFVELTRPGRAGNGEFRISNLFRLTYLPAHGKGPAHEWRRIETIEDAEKIAKKVRRTIESRRRKNKTPVAEKGPPPVAEKGPRPRFLNKNPGTEKVLLSRLSSHKQRGDTGLHSPSPSSCHPRGRGTDRALAVFHRANRRRNGYVKN
jgi:hypothetical protein